MGSTFSHHMRSDSTELELGDALRQRTTKLLGVSAMAGAALEAIGISTIFDLGAASLFAKARAAAAAGGPGELAERHGMAPGDWLKPGTNFGALDQISELPLESLHGLTDEQANDLKSALDVTTIGEFANWPPQRVAREMLGDTVGSALTLDEIQTEALRPRFGEYPTERVYYTSLVMLDSGRGDAGLTDLDGPLSVTDAMGAATGFDKPAVGALVTFSQSWYAQGITLGQMLHSLALAPGEATRIAVIDFKRTVAARASESVSESEALSSQTAHQRALSEVQSSVAREMQLGGSTSHVHSESDSGGVGLGLSAIVPVSGALLGGALGGSYQGASTTTDANSTSWSLGKRSVTASMTQNVNDRTEQHSTHVRNRRATAVREVSENEHQQVSTRIVANYNHMHALTVQYYEVVQIYRVLAEVQTAERVLFLPIELTDFSSDEIIEAFRGVLARAALTARARELLLDPTSTVEVRPAKSFHSALIDAAFQPLLLGSMMRMAAPRLDAAADPNVASGATAVMTRRAAADIAPVSVTSFLASDDSIVRGSSILMRPIIRPRSSSLFYPDEVELVAVQLEGIAALGVTLSMIGGGTSALTLQANDPVIELASPVAIGDLADISIQKQVGGSARGLVRLHLSFRGRRFTSPAIPVSMLDSPAGTSFAVVRFSSDTADRKAELKAHLAANRAHYSAQVFRSLSSAAVVGLLSKFRWNGQPLVEQVEPKILSVAGNFIVLRAPVEPNEASGIADGAGHSQTWSTVLEDRQLSPRSVQDQRMVPIPTDGVFAEAVLGRSNSAEKLDITRFWNWQDSPAPLTPPELAPISTDSRALGETITPGQLGPATLNIVNPTNLPDPTGLSASLNALAAMNFRDMSGLAGTQGLAGTATTGTLTATTEAGRNATAMAGAAADVLKTAINAGYGRKEEGGVSAEGARINQGRDMDQRGVGGSGGGSSSGGAGGSSSTDGDALSTLAGATGGEGPPSPRMNTSREAAYADHGTLGYSPGGLGALSKMIGGVPIQLAGYENEDVQKAAQLAPHWKTLLKFKVPHNVAKALERRGMTVQTLESGLGDLSLDTYPVLISDFPVMDGTRMDSVAFVEHIRKNLNSFVNNSFAEFLPYSQKNPEDPNPDGADDVQRWQSVDPVGTVFDIKIPIDNGAVVCSAHNATGWIFSTVEAPDPGLHPVSGHRGFEIFEVKEGSGVYFLHTTGVDRKTYVPEDPYSMGALSQRVLWTSFQKKVAAFVNENGGQAEVMDPEIHTMSWESWSSPLGL